MSINLIVVLICTSQFWFGGQLYFLSFFHIIIFWTFNGNTLPLADKIILLNRWVQQILLFRGLSFLYTATPSSFDRRPKFLAWHRIVRFLLFNLLGCRIGSLLQVSRLNRSVLLVLSGRGQSSSLLLLLLFDVFLTELISFGYIGFLTLGDDRRYVWWDNRSFDIFLSGAWELHLHFVCCLSSGIREHSTF